MPQSCRAGNPIVQVVQGGLDIFDDAHGTRSVIATAAVEAYLDIDETQWVSPPPRAGTGQNADITNFTGHDMVQNQLFADRGTSK